MTDPGPLAPDVAAGWHELAVAGVPITRAARAWVAVGVGLVALGLTLVFIFQNLHAVRVHFLGLSGLFPLSLAMLAAGLVGGIGVLGLGSVHILQLRKLAGHRRPVSGTPLTHS